MNEYLDSIGGTIDEYTEAAAYYDGLEENNTKAKLKPCPFCGFAPKIVELKDNIKWNYKIQCTYCGAMFYGNTKRDCVARWNRRDKQKEGKE